MPLECVRSSQAAKLQDSYELAACAQEIEEQLRWLRLIISSPVAAPSLSQKKISFFNLAALPQSSDFDQKFTRISEVAGLHPPMTKDGRQRMADNERRRSLLSAPG